MDGPEWAQEEAARRRPAQNTQASVHTAGRMATHRAEPAADPVDPEQLALAIPRRMRVGKPTTIEVRAPRAGLEAWSGGGHDPRTREDQIITKAMAMRLKAPGGGFTIEIASPETQWSERQLDPLSDDIVSWRWIVTPVRSGRQSLQLSTSTRVVCRDGLAAATSLPEQNVPIRVAPNYIGITGKLALWIILAASGLALGHFGESLFSIGSSMIAQAIQR